MIDEISLQALQKLNQPVIEQVVSETVGRKNGSRYDAVREAAFGVGARGGLISKAKQINESMERVKRNLDVTYDFSPLMIRARVIPPVLTETREIYTQGDAASLRLAGRAYRVEAQARFSSRPPHWREYLSIDYGAMAMPSTTLLPKNNEEQEVWRKAVTEGWTYGEQQAIDSFEANLKRLNRDYEGMVRYHILALKNMVTMPVVAEQTMAINGEAHSMSLDETLLRITALPEFNLKMDGWMPFSTQQNSGGAKNGD